VVVAVARVPSGGDTWGFARIVPTVELADLAEIATLQRREYLGAHLCVLWLPAERVGREARLIDAENVFVLSREGEE
jgi:hypothetical protein